MPSKATLISIGDEILYGQTLDSNAHWISEQLDLLGVRVVKRYTIGDRKNVILETLAQAEAESDVILITGGLGPTSDDLTKPCLAEYFNTPLKLHKESLSHIQQLFDSKGREMTALNEAQAMLPASAIAVHNPLGTAPGMQFERNGKVIISMPGIPYEMRRMMIDSILPLIQKKYAHGILYHRIIRTIGIPESQLAEIIKPWENQLPKHIKLAYLPTMGTVKLRLTGEGNDLQGVKSQLDIQIQEVLPSIKKYVYGFDEESIEQAIGRMLKERNLTLSTAESCTGGFLSHKITSVPGSSAWFHGGMIPYSNEIKNKLLEVPTSVLEEQGAVSEAVVRALAENVRLKLKTDVGLSVSGVAGPSGGSTEKPVGTVWIGYADPHKTTAKKFHFTKDRLLNIQYTTTAALNMVRINLSED
ncbi:MAG: competence/damage-inducible protein A [Bacteroidota bacterium]